MRLSGSWSFFHFGTVFLFSGAVALCASSLSLGDCLTPGDDALDDGVDPSVCVEGDLLDADDERERGRLSRLRGVSCC